MFSNMLNVYAVILFTLGLCVVRPYSAAVINPASRVVASSLSTSFFRLSRVNVIGDDRILRGRTASFTAGECCNDDKAFAGHPSKVDLVIALDESGSVGFSNFEIMKTFIEDITSHFLVSQSATRVAVVSWSTTVTLEFDFNKYINNEGVKRGINGISYSGGWTATGDALNFIRTNLFSQSTRDTKKVLFIITDGKSNRQAYDPATEAQLLKRSGIEIFAFGIGRNVHDPELDSLSSAPISSHKFNVESFDDVSQISHLLEDTGCTNNVITYDACGRRCICSDGKLIDCKRVRKNFLDMTDLERCRYTRAVKRASTTEPFKSEYDQLIAIHEELFSTGIHGLGGSFLPWHRWYILAYENILRKVDCRVTVPYWDWSLDSDNPFTSDVWNSDTCKYTGLGGSGNPTCVTTGPFGFPGWRVTPSAGSSCLRRSHRNGVPDCVAVQDVLDATTAQFNDFHIGLEVVLHNTVHVSVGGTMSSVEASNAPEFFLHHGFIDKIWGDWQEKGLSYKIHHYYNDVNPMPGTVYSPRDLHDLDNQPHSVKVHYKEPNQQCEVAGRMLSISSITRMSLQTRLRLDPSPVPIIPRRALTLFQVSQSVINSLPQVTARLFGVTIQVEPPQLITIRPLQVFRTNTQLLRRPIVRHRRLTRKTRRHTPFIF